MNIKTYLDLLHTAEALKDTTRHCMTSGGRHESVAEHSWRLALMAFWIGDEFPELDMNKVIKMCLIHDLGEAFTGDIPVFLKTAADEEKEDALLKNWVDAMPEPLRSEMQALFAEMDARQTKEAKLYKALDGLEALIEHNESDISTWEENEYSLQLTYALDRMQFSPYMIDLREQVRQDSLEKIRRAKEETTV